MAEAFLDTNTLLYLISNDTVKADRAEALLRSGQGVVSVQVLNEFSAVALRKRALTTVEVRLALEPVHATCRIVPLTVATHAEALRLANRYRYAFYDCLIIAAALLADCDRLYSEDMQHGQMIDGAMTIVNPFA